MPSFRRLGEILIADYHVLDSDVRDALQAQNQGQPDRVGQFLVRRGILSDRDLATALGQQLGVPVMIGLPRLTVPEEILALVPLRCAEKKLVIPVAVTGSDPRRLVLAMADPTDVSVIEALEKLTGLPVQPAIATEEDVRRAFKVFYLGERTHADPVELTDSFEVIRTRLRTSDSLDVSGRGGRKHSGEMFVPKPLPLSEDDPIPMPDKSASMDLSRSESASASSDDIAPEDLFLVVPRDPDAARSTVGA